MERGEVRWIDLIAVVINVHGQGAKQRCSRPVREAGCTALLFYRRGIGATSGMNAAGHGQLFLATAGPDIGRDPVRPFSPDLGLEVEEGCRPCVPRPPAPRRRPVVVRKKKAAMGRIKPDRNAYI